MAWDGLLFPCSSSTQISFTFPEWEGADQRMEVISKHVIYIQILLIERFSLCFLEWLSKLPRSYPPSRCNGTEKSLLESTVFMCGNNLIHYNWCYSIYELRGRIGIVAECMVWLEESVAGRKHQKEKQEKRVGGKGLRELVECCALGSW